MGGRPVIAPGPSRRASSDSLKVALAFAAIYLVWGSTYLAIRYAVETIPPLVTAGIRHTIAGGILLAWALIRGYRPRREHWIAGIVVGALFFLIGHGSLHWAEQHVASGLAALLIATEPMFILLLAWMSGQQRISRLSGLGLAVGVVGAAMLLVTAGVTGEFHALHWSAVSVKSMLGLAYLIVFGSIVAFTAYTWLLQRCPPALVATHTYANPVVAVLLGWLLAS